MPNLPSGQRHTDPHNQGPLFRIKLAVEKSPMIGVLVGVTIALVVATLALVLVLGQQSKISGQADELSREKVSYAQLYDAATGVCHRLQTERDRTNKLAAIIYLTLVTSAQRENQLARSTPNRATHKHSALVLDRLGVSAQWTPPTDCSLAVGARARDYTAPTPTDFTTAVAASFIPKAARVLLGKNAVGK